MYKITFYIGDKKDFDEYMDEDDMRTAVEDALNDLENRTINSFTVSRISKGFYNKPFWED